MDGQRRDIEDDAIVNALTLDQNFNQTPLIETVPTPQRRTELSPRIDTQIGNNNTLTFRYQFWQNSQNNLSVGQFSLSSAAYNSSETDHTLQISDAQVISEKALTEVRFRFRRQNSHLTAQSSLPTISALGAFTGGGASLGASDTVNHSYELQDYTSVSLHKHFRSSEPACATTTCPPARVPASTTSSLFRPSRLIKLPNKVCKRG